MEYTDPRSGVGVNLDIPSKGNIGVLFSGGIDSAVLLYCLCDYIRKHNLQNDITIYPLHGKDRAAYNTNFQVPVLLNEIKTHNQDIVFADILMFESSIVYGHGKRILLSKRQNQIQHLKPIVRQYAIDFIMRGWTTTPPKEVLDQWNLPPLKLRSTDTSHYESHGDILIYRPFAKVDKKFIAFLYKKLNIPSHILDLTWSCNLNIYYEDYIKDPIKFSTPCNTCFHCKEKYWAFGVY